MSERDVFLLDDKGLAPGPNFAPMLHGIRECRPRHKGSDLLTSFGELAVSLYQQVSPEDIASVVFFNVKPPFTPEEAQAFLAGVRFEQEEVEKVEVTAQ